MVDKIDVKKLIDDASKSCCKEAYLVLLKNKAVRIGVGALLEKKGVVVLTIDVLIDLCMGSSDPDLTRVERAISLAKQLKHIGYALECREGSISCEKVVPEHKLNNEFLAVKHLLNELELN